MNRVEGAATPSTGWSSLVSRTAAAGLFVETVSGLGITFGPFHAATEWGLLLHTVLGVVTVLPLAWYCLRHWTDYSEQALSDVLLLGYVAVAALFLCLVSGLAVTAQALFAAATSPWLRYTHLGSTFLFVAATVPHLLISWFRRRNNGAAKGAAGWVFAGFGATALIALLVVGATYIYSGVPYHNAFPGDYTYPFGRQRPFAPSLAETSTKGAFDPRSLSGSDTCGASGCHTDIYEQWETSAHRYSAMDPLFQGIQTVMAKQNGPESTRYCGGCHDPISLFSGTKNVFATKLTETHGYNEGVSCLACHSIQKTDLQGHANYTMFQPAQYLWQWSTDHTAGAIARNFLIRSWPAEHDRLSKRMYKKPEYCAACHKQFIDQEVNRVGWVQLQNQYDNWAASHWNHKGDPKTTIECRECHMPLVASNDPAAGDDSDYNRTPDDHKVRSHRFLAANNFIPNLLRLKGAHTQTELTDKWLQGLIDIPEIRDKWAGGPLVRIRLETPASVSPGEKFPVRVILTSNKVGHDFPTGPLDMIQSWVALRVTDDQGDVVFTSGERNEKHFLPPGTFLFKAEPVDQYGNLIDRHNLWEMVGVRYRRSLFPGYSDSVEYEVGSPAAGVARKKGALLKPVLFSPPAARAGSGMLHVTATLRYRKIDQFLLNYILGENSGLTAPVVDVSSATADVCVRAAGAAACP